MTIYQKREGAKGAWLKAKELVSGTKAILVSETNPVESVFDGKTRTQNVSKIKVNGFKEVYNVSLNQTTINSLVDAFGGDSKGWMNKSLTIQTEKVMVAGRRVVSLYLVPEGYEVKEDDNGYLVIAKMGEEITTLNPSDIPF
jgi:hypothetical protein